MYIPISYWQTAGGDSNANAYYWRTNVVPFTYVFDGITISSSTSGSSFVTPTCIDLQNISSIVTGTNYMTPAGGLFFCSAQLSGSSQCCINTPPNTGPEAWYIDVIYRIAFDLGTMYYNYIDQFGNIINDTIDFGQTKRIISQAAPLFFRNSSNFYDWFMDFNVVQKFTGQVIPYPYRNVPVDYTIQLKRQVPFETFAIFPVINFTSASVSNGFPISANTGIFYDPPTTSSIGTTITLRSAMPPLDCNQTNNQNPGAMWITNVTPVAKGALRLQSCTTTHSLWVTLNDYSIPTSGSIIRTNSSALNATASCWTIMQLTSSLSTSVSLNNVQITNTYATCYGCISGSLTASLNVDYLLVAGGGGGGAGNSGNGPGAGGGAGGLLSGSYTLQPENDYSIVIGLGGRGGSTNAQDGVSGGNSTAFGFTSISGGFGAGNFKTGSNGGSGGGGGAQSFKGGLGTTLQGNAGGSGSSYSIRSVGGGGGGASSIGQTPNNSNTASAGSGGSGSQWLDGNWYAGGGGGGGTYFEGPGNVSGSAGIGGIGGGGTGGYYNGANAQNATANTGGGGGGGASPSTITAGSGSAGVLIVRYPGTTRLIGGGNVSISGSYVYHTFTSSAFLST